MARRVWSPMARGDSQLFPRATGSVAPGRYAEMRIGGNKGQAVAASHVPLDAQVVTRERLAADDVAQVVGKMLERRQAAGFGVEMSEVEAPAFGLAAAMLANEAIQPALQPPVRRK
jgi:hypothetical protein